MSYQNLIQDGTGKGFMAQVDATNKVAVRGVVESTYDERGKIGEAFNVNTQLVPFASTGTTETPLLYLVNNELSDVELLNFFAAVGLSSAGVFSENPLFRVYGNPVGVTGGVDVGITNRRVGSPRTFALNVKKQDAGTPLVWAPSGTPILYQTLTQSNRAIGTVNLHLGPSASVIVTFASNLAASTVSAYAGFAGFADP